MNPQIPFSAQAITLKISVTTSASTSTALPAIGTTLRVVNEGTNTVFVSVGTGAQTATVPATSSPVATCTAILSGEDASFTIPNPAATVGVPVTAPTPLNISAITATGTATIYVSVGEGV